MRDRIFVTGIGTNVGKTYVSAAICNNFGHYYWKPVQTGFSGESDSEFVKSIIGEAHVLPERYSLYHPVSPDWAAKLEDKYLDLVEILPVPKFEKLCVEGAGGILVPLNEHNTFLDFLVKSELHPVIVIKHYLGSINHSLLTLGVLAHAGILDYTIVWNGNGHQPSEESILERHSPSHIYRLSETTEFNLISVRLEKEL